MAIAGLCDAARYFIISLLGEAPGKKVLHVCAERRECERDAACVSSISGREVPVFLSRGMEKNRSLFEKKEITEPERIHSLVSWEKTGILCADAASLTEILAPPAEFATARFAVEEGTEADRDDLAQKLSEIGYAETDFTERRGQMSVRGAIVDLFSPGSELPVRIEFFGDSVNSVREFSPSTQKSVKKIRSSEIAPASFALYSEETSRTVENKLLADADTKGLTSSEVSRALDVIERREHFREIEWFTPFFWKSRKCLLDYPTEDLVISLPEEFLETELLANLEEKFETRKNSLGKLEKSLPRFDELYLDEKELSARLCDSQIVFAGAISVAAARKTVKFSTEEISFREPSAEALVDEARKFTDSGYDTFAFFTSEAEKGKFLGLCRDLTETGVTCLVGELSESVVLHDFGIVLFTEKSLFEKTRTQATSWKAEDIPSAFLTSFSSLSPGDHIVHRECGVGIFKGLKRLSFGNAEGDFIECEYAGGDKVFVPVEKSGLVAKYMGDGRAPKIEKLGSANWKRTVGRVKKEVELVAEDLLELTAERRIEKGFQFSPRDRMFSEFELGFPWSETPDQSAAIEDVMADMESEKPMDRLVCGDVGFGKTEVALRAAFKASLDGKQVLIIAPTTLLASQHYRTSLERLGNYPVTIGMLSRFTSGKKEREILGGLEDGSLDIVVGTHKLLGEKVKPRNLGLAVIDEEQKFGVNHKKKIRSMKKAVDVLTLSATPIPRTLQLSLADVRDISIINTPPEGRQPVEVYIQEFYAGAVAEAARKETARGGIVFFIHNRIEDIFEKAEFLRELLPELSIDVTHGRMNERRLSETIAAFAEGKIDILVTTAIVESGLDIPKANTIIVNNAHIMGLADLYQLKGRVGRSDRKAYAHFLIPSLGSVTREARKRLKVLSHLTDLGSGFKLALSDLEIRGAGTLFGKRQSGHIAEVGLEFYLELLKDTIESKKEGRPRREELKTEIKTRESAFIPEEYMEDGSQRLLYYKKISSAGNRSEINEIAQEAEDRFGTAPEVFRRLIAIARLRAVFKEKSIEKAEIGKMSAVLTFAGTSSENRNKVRVSLPEKDVYGALEDMVEKMEKPA